MNSRIAPRERRILLGILAGALVVRLAVMWMPGDPMFENGRLPFEELQRGNATHDLMHGTLLPVLDYSANHFSGGSLFDSILAIPLFWIFGPTFNALRLVSLFFTIPLVAVTFLLVRRKCSLRAAVTASSLVAFGPPGFLFVSCTVFGAHPEATCLNVLLLWLWFGWHDAGREGRLRSFVLGTAIGFGLWYSYGLVVIVGILVLQNVATTKFRRIGASDVWLGVGFLLGFSPWIAYMVTHPGAGFRIYDASIADHVTGGLQHTDMPGKLAHLLAQDGPASFWMHGAWEEGGIVVARVLLYAFIAAILWCAWVGRAEFAQFLGALVRRRTGFTPTVRLVALLFVGAWFAAYVLTDFEVDWDTWVQGYRYLIPLWPFMAIVIGIAVEDLAARGRVLIPALAVTAVCVTNTAFTLVQSRPDRWSSQWAAAGTFPTWHMRMLVLRFGWDEATMRHVLRRALETRTPEEQAVLVETLAQGIARFATEPALDPKLAARQGRYQSTLDALCASGPEPFRPAFQRARAEALRSHAPPVLPPPPERKQ